jgi:hypothetical protein
MKVVAPLSVTPAMTSGLRPKRSVRKPVVGADMMRARALEDSISVTRKMGTPKEKAKSGLASC